jgi:hypothetical protein
MARGIDQVRTCGTEEGFGILEQYVLILGNEVLKLLAFFRREMSLGVFVEQPVKSGLALGIESLQIDGYRGFSHGARHSHILFEEAAPTLPKCRHVCKRGEKLSSAPDCAGTLWCSHLLPVGR